MTIQLIQGKFTKQEALSIITKLIDVKIQFQEEKIKTLDNEEDIKMREIRIKNLQNQLSEFRNLIDENRGTIKLSSDIQIF